MSTFNYMPRLADRRLAELMAEFPAVLVNGPRAVGKTTTARRCVADVVSLEQPAQAAAFRADPDAALRTRDEPLLLDEWQEVPEVLGAVRRAVDEDGHPARFVLTGSVRSELERAAWPATGRLVRMSMYGLTEVEAGGAFRPARAGFLDRLEAADPAVFPLRENRTRLPEYVELAIRGGFPDIVFRSRSSDAATVWLDSYLEQLLNRDVLALDPRRDTNRMRRYFEALALSTAGTPQASTLFDAAGISARTASAYDRLFSELFIADQIPAWASNRLTRLTHVPKRFIVDPALAATACSLSARSILEDGNLTGRILDTFAVSQLRAEVALAPGRQRLHHLRTKEGRHEIDVIAELGGRRLIGLEIKATASPTAADATHLAWLRDAIGDRFVAGAVIHTGPDAFALSDRILAVPLCAMWR